MLFSVIYEADTTDQVSIRRYYPPSARRLWDRTESGKSEYAYLEGAWAKGRHGKWCAILTREQFDEFVRQIGLAAEDVETMGSIGAPGCGFGCAPAISFRSDEYDAILSAYVTPLPTKRNTDEPIRKEGCSERDWRRIRRAVISAYA